MMLSMVLMVALLSATWSLLGIFRDRVERAQTQTEQRHVTRSLQITLAADLENRFRTTTPGASVALPVRETVAADDTIAETTPPATELESSGSEITPPNAARRLLTDTQNDTRASVGGLEQLTADPIATGLWKSADRIFLGTPQSVQFDVLSPAMPGRSSPPSEPPNLEDAAIPDVVRRVVYVFTDPALAFADDRAPGLLRGEFTTRQLLDFAMRGAETDDLLTFVRPTLEKLAPEALAPPVGFERQTPASESLGQFEQTPTSPMDDGDSPNDAQLNMNADEVSNEPPPDDPQGLLQHIDYAPEVATFLLRYYDGSSWATEWDSRQQQGRWPVAVELRFQLQHELPQVEGDATEGPDGTNGVTGAENMRMPPAGLAGGSGAANPLEPMEDELRSAQTQPLNDHRYLIVLEQREFAPTTSDDQEAEDASFAVDRR
ncbi:MAG: hypothetical protein KDB23_13505 [Planctomycetales bacterium]|nr:hypothetical protein [Planctomycetales bacterium]